LTYWPSNRYLELSTKHWRTTHSRLRLDELTAPLCAFAMPPPLGEFAETAAPAMTA